MTPTTSGAEYRIPEGEVLVSKTDLAGIITYCNSAFIDACGYSRDELMCASHNLLRHPDMPKLAYADLWHTIRSNKPWRGLIKNRRKDGGYYWCESDITPFIENGVTTGYVAFRYNATAEQIAKTEAGYRRIKQGSPSLYMHEGKIVELENRLARWLNASSIKFRIAAFLSALFGTLIAIGVFNLREASNAHRFSVDSLEATRMESYALDTARIAELDTQRATTDPAAEREQAESTFHNRLILLKTLMLQAGLPGEMVDQALSTRPGDVAVRAARLEAIVSTIQDAQQNRLRDLNYALEKSHSSERMRAIVMLVVAGMVGLFLSMRFVVSLTQPMRRTTKSLKKLVRLQQHFLNIILKLEVYRDRLDDEQRVGSFIMTRMTAMDSGLDAQIQRYTRPAGHLSGDVLIAAATPSDIVHILLADAVGHGLTAAINVLPLCQTFYDLTHKGFGIARIATELNRMINLYMPTDRFVPATLVAIDRRNKVIEVWNGGIPPLQLFALDGRLVRQWESCHLPLGILSEANFSVTTETHRYLEDVQLCLYSDGLIEANSPAGEPFDVARILELFGNTPHAGRFDALIGELDRHLGSGIAHDDISFAIVNISSRIELPVPRPARQDPVEIGDWKISSRLSACELKQLEPVALLSRFTARLPATQAHNATLFVMLTELVEHALDCGLLGLAAHAAMDSEQHRRHMELRDERLNALNGGAIELSMEDVSIGGEAAVRIRIEISGGKQPDWSGITLTRSLASRIEISERALCACYLLDQSLL